MSSRRVTKEIVSSVLEAQRIGLSTDSVKVPGTEERVLLPPGSSLNMSGLTKVRRQFITYAKNRGASGHEDVSKLASMFVQYLNSSLKEEEDE